MDRDAQRTERRRLRDIGLRVREVLEELAPPTADEVHAPRPTLSHVLTDIAQDAGFDIRIVNGFIIRDQFLCDLLLRFLFGVPVRCPACGLEANPRALHRHPPYPTLRCTCGKLFAPNSCRPWSRCRRDPQELVYILRGMARGTPTAQLARELRCDRKQLAKLRKKLSDADLTKWYEHAPYFDVDEICDWVSRMKEAGLPLNALRCDVPKQHPAAPNEGDS